MAAASLLAFLVPTKIQMVSVHSFRLILFFGGLGAVNSTIEVGDPLTDLINNKLKEIMNYLSNFMDLSYLCLSMGTDRLDDNSELSSNES